MTDDLNPGIRKTVAWLNAHGFETTDSGDGATGDHPCDREYGYVTIVVAEAEDLVRDTSRLVVLLRGAGLRIDPIGEFEPGDGRVSIQATYDPADGSAIIDIENVTDAAFPGPLVGPS